MVFGNSLTKPYQSGNASAVGRYPPNLCSLRPVFRHPSSLAGEGLGVRGEYST
jgi:hypothetical protein